MKEKAIAWFDRVVEISLCVLIFSLPFSKSMIEVFFGIALLGWLGKRFVRLGCGVSLVKAFKPVGTVLNLPIAAFVFIGFLSVLTSVSLKLSIEGFFFKLFEWIMIYFMVVEVVSSRKKLNRILVVLFFSACVAAADGIFQFITGADFVRQYTLSRSAISASFHNANDFAGWLVMLMPVFLSLAYFWRDKWISSERYKHFRKAARPALWVLTSFLMICLALTYSKGAWITAILALLFIGFLKSRKLLITVIALVLILPFIAPNSMKERALQIFESGDSSSVGVRTNLWREASHIIKDHPLTGCGLNTYSIVAPGYKVTEKTGFYPHNSYLHMAAETGLLGLGAFLWIIIALFRTSLKRLREITDDFHGAFLVGALAGLFGFLLHSFVDTNFYSLQLGGLMWFVMGLVIAIQKISLNEERA